MKKNAMLLNNKDALSMEIAAKNKKEINKKKMIIIGSSTKMVIGYAGLLVTCSLIGSNIGKILNDDSDKKVLHIAADAIAFIGTLISWGEIVNNEFDTIEDAMDDIYNIHNSEANMTKLAELIKENFTSILPTKEVELLDDSNTEE